MDTDSAGEAEAPQLASGAEAETVARQCMAIAGDRPQRHNLRFVGSHPISLQRKHFEQLTRNHGHDYVVSRKMNGERALVLVMNGRFWMLMRNFSVWRSRFDGYLLSPRCDLQLLDVEWIRATSTICVIDVVSRGIAQLPILQRIHSVQTSPLLSVLSLCFQRCRIYVQRYFALADFRMIAKPQTEEMDGYVFVPRLLPYVYGRDSNMFKAKELQNNTVDLLVAEGGRLYVKNRDKDGEEHLVFAGRLLNYAPETMPDGLVLECVPVDALAEMWHAQRPRRDKIEPNEEWVYLRVLESIAEDIRFAELCDLPGVR